MDLAQLRHRYHRSEWWGSLVCLVVEDVEPSPSQEYRIGWISKVPSFKNILQQLCHKMEQGLISGIPKHKYPHLLILYIPFYSARWSYVRDRFQLIFYSSSLKSKLVIKKCGWRVLCKEDAENWRRKLSECNTNSSNQCVSNPRGGSLSPHFSSWRWISRLKVPQHCKTFLLAILCDRLPANERCTFCCLEGTVIHVLRDCTRATAIWVQMIPPEVCDEFFSTSLHDWMHRFLQKPWFPYRDHYADCLRFTVTTWLLWKDRNSSILKRNSPTDNDGLYSLIQSLVKEYAMLLHLKGEEGTSAANSLSENSRLKHFIKLSVDGCCNGNPGNAGYGGLFRDVEGKWLGGFFGSLGLATNVKAELFAICQGLITAWDLGYRTVLVESDSLEAINLIEANIEDCAYGGLLADIRSLMQRNWSLDLIHSLRQDNACADILSKLGAEQHEVYCFLAHPPQQLQQALVADALQVQLPCM